MYSVYYDRDKEQLAGTFERPAEIRKFIEGDIAKTGFEISYFRIVGLDDDTIMVDYGSYYNFYYISTEGIDFFEFIKLFYLEK